VSDAILIGVLLSVDGDGCKTNGLARPPTYALQGENRVGIVGEGFILVRHRNTLAQNRWTEYYIALDYGLDS
jgi:hypothetical protein